MAAAADNAEARKQALRLFTYGLYALLVQAGEGAHGVTVNWATQASFDPPLVAVSIENDSRTIGLLRQYGRFTLNVYEAGQRELAGQLGKHSRNQPEKFKGVDWALSAEGVPYLTAGLGYVTCRVTAELPAGDSTLFLAEVVAAQVLAAGEPLTMRAAGFRHAG